MWGFGGGGWGEQLGSLQNTYLEKTGIECKGNRGGAVRKKKEQRRAVNTAHLFQINMFLKTKERETSTLQ